ncbi:uncharacterized protein BDZ99DRAFT_492962 [Mytilinidion resinicola]|uniref:SPRY domain-containing protein n=1 Tax=Mytilinidion resinicola TaxID=574789 RepID=A0A6A6Z8M2_9PEZI|nr:uncharacterized protein BDZ99DRAFT_492962 [Mytilinidion resinicola]KAF2817059.1 hypothetical protein BDZ99DRAFT_492962 [Mytilinidion resinicola]
MAEQPQSRGSTPGAVPPLRRPLEDDHHAPAVSSPLNPNPDAAARSRPARPPPREQREKRETLKKREASASARGSTPNPKSKKNGESTPSPMRYSVPEPKVSDYEVPKDGIFASHEPNPILTPDEQTELKKAVDHAWNKKGYRYTHCVADPHFRHKQFYRQSDSRPYGPRMSHEDCDKWFHFDESASMVTNEKGWRMGRGNVVAREGRLYYEVKVVKGIPTDGPPALKHTENGHPIAQPHVRMGWARREAPLDAPVGFDGYSYAITDLRLETMHRSRASKIFKPLPKGTKSKYAKARPPHGKPSPVEYITDMDVREGDVIGLEIQLPSLSMHRKVVEGIYNPAVDIGDGFDVGPHSSGPRDPLNMDRPLDIIRDRIPVPYKGNFYFEQLDYVATKPMESYSDRGPTPKTVLSPNHDDPPLRSLPHSAIKVYKNGKDVGIAFENLLAFLPPASAPSAPAGARLGFDDGMVGYFPCIAAFCGGIAQVNFGPDFWCPPEEIVNQSKDVDMAGSDANDAIPEGRKLRAIGDRYKEQIAEDVVWDIIDEVDFFIQDGGWDYRGEVDPSISTVKATPTARGMAGGLDDGVGVEVGRRY